MLTGQSLVKRDLRAFDGEGVQAVRALLRSADCAFTNFEGTIRGAYGGWPMKDRFMHAADPVVLDCLADFGFNLLALSNNHAFDLGPAGILSTLEECASRGLITAGAGTDLQHAASAGILKSANGRVALVSMNASDHGELIYARNLSSRLPARPGINGQHVRRGVRVPDELFAELARVSAELGNELRKAERLRMGFPQAAGEGGLDFYGAWVERGEKAEELFRLDADDLERNLATITAAAAECDAVIAYVHQHHWSPRWQDTPLWLRDLGRRCVDAGATMFVSHGVPMMLGTEFHAGRPMFFGLGNFLFHTYRVQNYPDDANWESAVIECDVRDGNINITAHPVFLRAPDREFPELVAGTQRRRILAAMDRLSRPFGVMVDPGSGRISPRD